MEGTRNQEQYWLSYIDALVKAGQVDQAARVLQQGRESGLKGDKVDALARQLQPAGSPTKEQLDGLVALYSRGKLQEALDAGNELAARFPDTPGVLNILGAVNSSLGNYEISIDHYRNAIELNPGTAELHNNLGNVLHSLGKYEEAISSFNESVELNPHHSLLRDPWN